MTDATQPITKSERELLQNLIEARDVAARADQTAKEARELEERAEGELIRYMSDREVKATAKYEGIGFASLDEPKLFARCNKPEEAQLFQFIRDQGRADLIKEGVHHSSLSGFVKELMDAGKELPPFIAYGFKSTLKVYKRP